MSHVERCKPTNPAETMKTNGILDEVEDPVCRKLKNTSPADQKVHSG